MYREEEKKTEFWRPFLIKKGSFEYSNLMFWGGFGPVALLRVLLSEAVVGRCEERGRFEAALESGSCGAVFMLDFY